MTTRIHVLTAPRLTNAGYCFLWPLLRFRAALGETGISIRLLYDLEAPGLADCDILLIEARALGEMRNGHQARLLELVARLSEQTTVVWADNYDSSGQVFAEILPIVHGYWKSQLLADPRMYGQPHYGGRIYTDYYHSRFGIEDDTAQASTPITDEALLRRLAVSWNMGLSDHSAGARWMEYFYARLHLPLFMQAPAGFHPPAAPRPQQLSARFGKNYARRTIAFQRARLLEALHGRIATNRISRTAFRRELRSSRAVLSPYGWGEVCLRDFEIFLSGAALIKPDMDHLRTWPNWYRQAETYYPIKWNMSDLDAVLESITTVPVLAQDIARNGQMLYYQHTAGKQAAGSFSTHLNQLIRSLSQDTQALQKQPKPNTTETTA
ncbi:MAG: hypothetical protein OJJ21_15245 [Ferrovibrio sp.]|uniref:hypothetical protein n=1 Tax=Ferrovibrio sp. TaxID=1917215 RepID=UPI002623F19A|nr:hypothetical protein [Ferrovibrio sp.]MCW0234955.1 hypothetical protein [Ferrovibrio sp.]